MEETIVAKTAAPFVSMNQNAASGPPPKLHPKPVFNLNNMQANQNKPIVAPRGSQSPPEEQPPPVPSGPPPSRLLPARNKPAAVQPLIRVESDDDSQTYETYESISGPQPPTPFAMPGAPVSSLSPAALSPAAARRGSTSSGEYEPEPEPNAAANGSGALDAAALRQKQLAKRAHAIQELLNTERAYLVDCELCMRVFLSASSVSDQLRTLEVSACASTVLYIKLPNEL